MRWFSTNPVTISAPLDATGAPLVTLTRSTVSGTPPFGIIHFSASADASTGLQITNGNSGMYLGGGVLAGGNADDHHQRHFRQQFRQRRRRHRRRPDQLTVQHSIVSGNTAGNAGGGVYGGSGVDIDYSTIENNSTTGATVSINGGGGVFGRASFSLLARSTSSTTRRPRPRGGVYSAFGMNVAQSTISGNIADGRFRRRSLFESRNDGAALASQPQHARIGNTAQGNGGGVLGGTVGLENSTLTGNVASGTGGGVQAGDADDQLRDHRLRTSRRAQAAARTSPHRPQVDSTILYGNTSGSRRAGRLSSAAPPPSPVNHDIIGATDGRRPGRNATTAIRARRARRQRRSDADHGAGRGSCAIDGADTMPSVDTDQRGYARVRSAAARQPIADIGAYEAGAKDPDVIFRDGFGG